ncbi:MAG: DUF3298 and DUF4163 domain-containing protein [Sphingobacteriales bacterium JAD_PAG50586_3]|nr:MAG: DUF3298 and DUF4163 domain-containing protein [Sphingobacteriales bacterium JAD_PAG50586_3]
MKYILISIPALLLIACGGKTDTSAESSTIDSIKPANAAATGGIYSGTLNGDTLVVKLDISNKIVSGNYFKKGSEDMVTLSGAMLQGDSAEVYEFSKSGDKGGVFKGLFKGGESFTGNWKTLPNGTPQPFAFNKTTLEFNAVKYAGLDTLAYEIVKKNKRNKTARCNVKIQYAQLANANKKPEIDKINASIKKYAEAALSDCDGLERDEFSKDMPDFESEAIGGVIYNHKKILGVDIGWYNYLGGAHPNHGTNTYYYDVTTGRELKLIDLVQGPNLVKLSKLATASYNKAHKVKKASDGGLFQDNINLKGTEAFYITAKGITLTFSPYEIAPYVVGDIEVDIDLADLKPLITERSPFFKIFN